jgi:hypothetical protein
VTHHCLKAIPKYFIGRIQNYVGRVHDMLPKSCKEQNNAFMCGNPQMRQKMADFFNPAS